jgi:putative membrane protein
MTATLEQQQHEWQRLHPLSAVVRGGRGTIALAFVLVPSILLGRENPSRGLFDLGAVAIVTLLAFISWLVTRWRLDGDDLLIETGLIRRHSERYPLSQLQAIDIVRPGLARMVGVAELRLRMGGSTGAHARLAYLSERDAVPLRDELLDLARQARQDEPRAAPADASASANLIAELPTGRLIVSMLISDVGIVAVLVTVGLIVTAAVSTRAAVAAISIAGVWILTAGQIVWRRFNQGYRFSVTDTPDGMLLHGGLVALTTETIRPGRVQAVRMVEPLFWRPFGWCRLELDVAGRQRRKGEGREAGRRLRAALPVGTHQQADELLDRLLPDRPRGPLEPAPARARWKSPLRYRKLGWSRTTTCAVTRSGRVRRVTCWVPLRKVQSFREVQGPVQRLLDLASVHLDTAGGNVHAILRDRDTAEADSALVELVDNARAARAAA